MSRLWDIVKHRLVQYKKDPVTGRIDISVAGNAASPYNASNSAGGLSAILLGDSISASNSGVGPYTTDQKATHPDGWFTAFNILAGKPFTSVWNAAKGGDKTADIVARLAADVTPYRADYGFLMAGTNDFGFSLGLAQAQSNYLLIVAALRARVDKLVLIPVLPRDTLNPGSRVDMIEFNRWLKSTVAPAYSAIVADIGRSIVDVGSATLWDMQAQYSRDVTGRLHPNDLCANVLGAALLRYFPALRSVARSSPMDGSNLLANGELAGTTTPTSWTVYGTVSAHTRTNRADGEPGVFYGATTTDFLNMTQSVVAGFSVGSRYVYEFEFLGAPVGTSIVYAQVSLSGGEVYADNKPTATVTGQIPSSGVLRTPEFVIPSGCTSITCFCFFDGAGTYKMARPHLRKVS